MGLNVWHWQYRSSCGRPGLTGACIAAWSWRCCGRCAIPCHVTSQIWKSAAWLLLLHGPVARLCGTLVPRVWSAHRPRPGGVCVCACRPASEVHRAWSAWFNLVTWLLHVRSGFSGCRPGTHLCIQLGGHYFHFYIMTTATKLHTTQLLIHVTIIAHMHTI